MQLEQKIIVWMKGVVWKGTKSGQLEMDHFVRTNVTAKGKCSYHCMAAFLEANSQLWKESVQDKRGVLWAAAG